MNWDKRHDIVMLVAMLASMLALAFLSVFVAALPGGNWNTGSFRLFFYHIPIAWAAYLSFGIVFVASIGYLRTRNARWDMLAAASAEIGVLLTTLALLTGSMWSEAQNGYWWTWEDAKLFTTFILWMAYVAYVALRAGVRGEARARLAAVFGIIAFVFVPLSFFSSRFLVSVHTSLSSYPLPAQNIGILILGVVAFTLLFIALLRTRYGIEKIAAQVEVAKDQMEETT